MAARRVTATAIDWAAFAARVSPDQKAEFNAFKGLCDSYLRNVNALPESLPKIYWDNYSTRIAVPGMVEEFKKQYESLKIPYPVDNYTAKITEVEKKKVQLFVKESEKTIADYQEKLAKWEAMIPITEMTLEEYAEEFPDRTINLDKPTMWPHTPEYQPGYVAEEEEKH